MITSHPIDMAREISRLLEADPIAATLIKEYIGEERLCELFGIEPTDQYPQLEVTLEDVMLNHSKADILKALNNVRGA